MARRTHYEVLDVEHDSSTEEIKAAYRHLARVLHPDQGGSAALFDEISKAHEVLTDPARRAAYDQSLGFGSTSGGTDAAPRTDGDSASYRVTVDDPQATTDSSGGAGTQGQRAGAGTDAPLDHHVAEAARAADLGGDVWVFHALSIPGSDRTVEHAVVLGERLIVLGGCPPHQDRGGAAAHLGAAADELVSAVNWAGPHERWLVLTDPLDISEGEPRGGHEESTTHVVPGAQLAARLEHSREQRPPHPAALARLGHLASRYGPASDVPGPPDDSAFRAIQRSGVASTSPPGGRMVPPAAGCTTLVVGAFLLAVGADLVGRTMSRAFRELSDLGGIEALITEVRNASQFVELGPSLGGTGWVVLGLVIAIVGAAMAWWGRQALVRGVAPRGAGRQRLRNAHLLHAIGTLQFDQLDGPASTEVRRRAVLRTRADAALLVTSLGVFMLSSGLAADAVAGAPGIVGALLLDVVTGGARLLWAALGLVALLRWSVELAQEERVDGDAAVAAFATALSSSTRWIWVRAALRYVAARGQLDDLRQVLEHHHPETAARVWAPSETRQARAAH